MDAEDPASLASARPGTLAVFDVKLFDPAGILAIL
jgi:hypothetical protein